MIIFIKVPLPTWSETKDRLRKQMDDTRRGHEERSRKWEEKEKVLGHLVKSDISKPRAVLSVPVQGDNTGIDSPKLFTTVLWGMRAAANRGFGALYTTQVNHLISF